MPDFIHRIYNINTYFDMVFYINLEKDVHRNQRMQAQFQNLNITNIERIDAITFKELPDPAYYRNFNKSNTKYILGSLSCRASHIQAIRLAKERGYSKILILEDDVIFLNDPSRLLTLNYEILNDWDMLYFGGDVEPFYRNQIVRAHAYAVKNTLFDNIIFMAETSGMEIDNFYAKIIQHMSYNHNQSGKYNIRIIVPFDQLRQSDNFESNIQ